LVWSSECWVKWGIIPSLDMQSVFLLIHPRTLLCCQGGLLTHIQLADPRAPRAFSAELLPKPSVPSWYYCQGALYHQPWPGCLSIDLLKPLRSPSQSEKYDKVYSKSALFWSGRQKRYKKTSQTALDICVWARSIYSPELNPLPAQLPNTSLCPILSIYQWESDEHLMKNRLC